LLPRRHLVHVVVRGLVLVIPVLVLHVSCIQYASLDIPLTLWRL
jgi:hypothetical protein